jgi:uncharacterized protein (TIGR00251 family)
MDAIRSLLPSWARLSTDERSIALTLHVQPSARASAISGRHGDALKVRIAAPAAENRANATLIELLSEALAVPASAIRITRGDKSRRKVVQIAGDLRQMTNRLRIWDQRVT